jgi:hypothetical protein
MDKGHQVFASGYCKFASVNEEKTIEERIKIHLPMHLKTQEVVVRDDDLALLLSTSAAEQVLEQSKHFF